MGIRAAPSPAYYVYRPRQIDRKRVGPSCSRSRVRSPVENARNVGGGRHCSEAPSSVRGRLCRHIAGKKELTPNTISASTCDNNRFLRASRNATDVRSTFRTLFVFYFIFPFPSDVRILHSRRMPTKGARARTAARACAESTLRRLARFAVAKHARELRAAYALLSWFSSRFFA